MLDKEVLTKLSFSKDFILGERWGIVILLPQNSLFSVVISIDK